MFRDWGRSGEWWVKGFGCGSGWWAVRGIGFHWLRMLSRSESSPGWRIRHTSRSTPDRPRHAISLTRDHCPMWKTFTQTITATLTDEYGTARHPFRERVCLVTSTPTERFRVAK